MAKGQGWQSVLKVIDPTLILAMGSLNGFSTIHKFGNAPNFDTGDNEVTVWDGAEENAVWELMTYVYSTTAAIDSISSTDAGDGQDVEIQGLDANWELTVQTVTLNGQTRVALPTNLIRIFRAKNVGATNLAGHVIIYENDTTVDDAGVPDDSTLIRCVIHPENNQTEMAIFTIPSGKTGYLKSFYTTTAGASRSAEYLIKLKARKQGGIFQLKHKFALQDGGTTAEHHDYHIPQSFSERTDIEMTAQVLTAAITDANIISGFDIILVDND